MEQPGENVFSQAAVGRRKIVQGHDEENGDLIQEGARELYSALTDADEESLEQAGRMMEDAFYFADEAEKHQMRGDKNREKMMYDRSTRLLKELRDEVGLAWEPMEYRGNGWWKADRQDNDLGVIYGLIREHVAEFGYTLDAFRATKKLIEGNLQHKKNNWEGVDYLMTDYYEIVWPYLAET